MALDVAINLGIVGYCVAFWSTRHRLGRSFNGAVARVHGLVRLAFVSLHALRYITAGIAAMVNQRSRPIAAKRSLQRLARPEASDADIDAALASLGETVDETSSWTKHSVSGGRGMRLS